MSLMHPWGKHWIGGLVVLAIVILGFALPYWLGWEWWK